MPEKTNHFTFQVEKNAIKADGEDTIQFTRPVTITDDTEQYNGTKYDIPSMKIEWDGKLNMDHSNSVMGIIGRVFGIKQGRKRITIDGIKFAIKENAMARFARDMVLGGYATDFSIETVGPWPNDEGVYEGSALVGCALVMDGNNRSATLSQLVRNSIEESKKLGLDTHMIEELNLSQDFINHPSTKSMNYVTIKNSRGFAVKVTYKNASGEEVSRILLTGESVDVSDDQQVVVQNQVDTASEPTPTPAPTPTPSPAPQPEPAGNALIEAVKNLIAPIAKKQEEMEQKMFDNGVVEPSFSKPTNGAGAGNVAKDLAGMGYKKRHGEQINLAWELLKNHNGSAGRKLNDINLYHLDELKKANMVDNAVTLADFGNFVISPELITKIQGHRSKFGALLSRFTFEETLSLQMAWLKRSGDINMQEVEMCDDGANGNLKPISDYDATFNQSNLHELAAVTPVCNAATRFLAADLLGDVAEGYRTDYDRKRSQLVIARLEQAVEANGNSIVYNTTSDTNALLSWIDTLAELAEESTDGVLIMNYRTAWQLLRRMIGANLNGDIKSVFTSGELSPILGVSTILVPNELLPTLNTAETKAFVVEGTTITVNHAVFYVEPSNFKGRTSGGLNYDLSTDAAYEQGGTVKSAFQRNELVLRGSFFRGGAILDNSLVSALRGPGVS